MWRVTMMDRFRRSYAVCLWTLKQWKTSTLVKGRRTTLDDYDDLGERARQRGLE